MCLPVIITLAILVTAIIALACQSVANKIMFDSWDPFAKDPTVTMLEEMTKELDELVKEIDKELEKSQHEDIPR